MKAAEIRETCLSFFEEGELTNVIDTAEVRVVLSMNNKIITSGRSVRAQRCWICRN